MKFLHGMYKVWGCIIAAWVFAGVGGVAHLYFVVGENGTFNDLGIEFDGAQLLFFAIVTAAAGFGGALGWRYPSSMAGVN